MSNTDLTVIEPDLKSPLHVLAGNIQKKFKKPPQETRWGMLIDGQTKWLTHKFPDSFSKKYDRLDMIFLSDIQFGHKQCRVDKVKEYLDWVLKEPNRFILLGGDMLDAYRVGSPGAGYDNWCRPDSQIYQFCELIAPVRHRVLACIGGNHERRGLAGGVDLGRLLSMLLEFPYSEGAQMLSIEYGKHRFPKDGYRNGPEHPFRVYCWHGTGAASSPGGRINMTLKATGNDEAQVFISGHIHHPHNWPDWRTKRDELRQQMWHEKYYVVSASHFLNFYATYAEVGGSRYSGLLMPVVHVYADGRYRVEI